MSRIASHRLAHLHRYLLRPFPQPSFHPLPHPPRKSTSFPVLLFSTCSGPHHAQALEAVMVVCQSNGAVDDIGAASKGSRMVSHQDERVGFYEGKSVGSGKGGGVSGGLGTIAAVVTSVGGAVGIVSGPSSVGIVRKIFWPNKERRRRVCRPTSHVVEYGLVQDSWGNVVDEVCRK